MTENMEVMVAKGDDIRFGSLVVAHPKEVIALATDIAKALADIIKERRLYVVIGGREYVKVEGWTTLGAMLGLSPREVSVTEEEDGTFVAVVEVIRTSDMGIIAQASAMCSPEEKRWSKADRYAIRSMALTRATSKAYRMALAWIIVLAGYEPTPAEEMSEDFVIEGDAKVVSKARVEPAPQNIPMCNQHKRPLFWDKEGSLWVCRVGDCPAVSYAPSPDAHGEQYWVVVRNYEKAGTDLTPAYTEQNFMEVMVGDRDARMRDLDLEGNERLMDYLDYVVHTENRPIPPQAGRKKDTRKAIGQAASRLAFENGFTFSKALEEVERNIVSGKWAVDRVPIEGQKSKRLMCAPIEELTNIG